MFANRVNDFLFQSTQDRRTRHSTGLSEHYPADNDSGNRLWAHEL